jgi:hypothetical protein
VVTDNTAVKWGMTLQFGMWVAVFASSILPAALGQFVPVKCCHTTWCHNLEVVPSKHSQTR